MSDEPNSIGDEGLGGDATLLLARLGDGDHDAADELLPLVYEQLRVLAGGYFQRQRGNHTLQPTALVHEAYLKLVKGQGSYNSRAHFNAVAAKAMRQILMNYARSKKALKRGGVREDLSIDQLATPSMGPRLDLVALDEVLEKLKTLDEGLARLVELRFFGGLTMDEVAHVLDEPLRTVERHWHRARLWLNRELSDGERS